MERRWHGKQDICREDCRRLGGEGAYCHSHHVHHAAWLHVLLAMCGEVQLDGGMGWLYMDYNHDGASTCELGIDGPFLNARLQEGRLELIQSDREE